MAEEWSKYREKIIGLGESSAHKSYYPDLQQKISELEVARLYLQTLFDSTSDSIVIHDIDGKILLQNNQARKLFRLDEKDEANHYVFEILAPDSEIGKLLSIWQEVLEDKPVTLEWIIRPFGSDQDIPIQVSLSKTSWYGKFAVIAVVRDFTERKKYEEELIAAREMAEENDRLKSIFLANLSHEIRTPMNAILGFTELLRSSDTTQEEKENYIDIVRNSGEHLMSIINDIIEISRIEAGQVGPHNSVVNINVLMDDLYSSLKVTIPNEKNISFEIKKPSTILSDAIITDEVKLRQVLINLINNAIKFTDEGSVTFGYELISAKELKFTVSDTGVGIDPKYHEVIFERFRQVDGDLSIRKGGSGLGLAISKAYVEILGGKMSLESEPGKGSSFAFTIKLVSHVKSRPDPKSETDLQALNGENEAILIAEDDFYNYLYIEKLLGSNNFNLIRACNGKEAVDLCMENQNIKLVLMDIKMPVMNGYEALMKIKVINPLLPVVAQTAYAMPEDITRLKQEGFDGFLLKPIKRNEIFEVIRKYINSQ